MIIGRFYRVDIRSISLIGGGTFCTSTSLHGCQHCGDMWCAFGLVFAPADTLQLVFTIAVLASIAICYVHLCHSMSMGHVCRLYPFVCPSCMCYWLLPQHENEECVAYCLPAALRKREKLPDGSCPVTITEAV